MSSAFSIYHPAGRLGLKQNPFGKDVANLELFRALARHGGFEQLNVLSLSEISDEDLKRDMPGAAEAGTRLVAGSILQQGLATSSGTVLRGSADINDLAWMRRRFANDRAYSLMGLVHTLGPPVIRDYIGRALASPTHPWDAIICTSPAVQDALTRMFEEVGGYLAERTGGRAPPQPMLPVVPLGVDGEAFAAMADRPQARADRRAALGVGEDDIVVLWVGRLSFFEKAYPQPMFRAVQQAAQATGAKVHFLMAGWFPGQDDQKSYAEAAAAYAPDVRVEFLDGNDRALLGELWAAADVFISLVDNIQETFGITPIEAMAAGLPVVVSDWDGYRYTVRDGVEGFLIPTLGGPPGGVGLTFSARHVMLMDSYQVYVGAVAQHTAVHVGRAAQALTELIRNPDLRRRMGAAGRERVRTTFDWPVVAPQYGALADELAKVRAASAEVETRFRSDPAKGDPYRDFDGFPTQVISLDTRLTLAPGVQPQDVRAMGRMRLDRIFSQWRVGPDECVQALELIGASPGLAVREVLLAFPPPRRRVLELSLVWMAKHGFLDWLG